MITREEYLKAGGNKSSLIKKNWTKKVFYIIVNDLKFKGRKPIKSDFIQKVHLRQLGVLLTEKGTLPYFECSETKTKYDRYNRTDNKIYNSYSEVEKDEELKSIMDNFIDSVYKKSLNRIKYLKDSIKTNRDLLKEEKEKNNLLINLK